MEQNVISLAGEPIGRHPNLYSQGYVDKIKSDAQAEIEAQHKDFERMYSRFKEKEADLTVAKEEIAKLTQFKKAIANDRCTECPFLDDAEGMHQQKGKGK